MSTLAVADGSAAVADQESEGMDRRRLDRVVDAIRRDVERAHYDGGVLIVGRRGKVILHAAVGYSDRAAGRKASTDDVFAIMSLTKSLNTVLLLSMFEAGQVSLITPVSAVIPEYSALGKASVTIAQVLSHTAGLPMHPPVPPERYGDLEYCVAALCAAPMLRTPGTALSYSGWAAHYIIGEIIRRLDGGKRPLRKIMEAELFRPLGMRDTSLGLRPDLRSRRVPLVYRSAESDGYTQDRLDKIEAVITREDAELPSAGAYSTAWDIHRFAQMLAAGGALEGTRTLSPITIRLAASNWTGTMINDVRAGIRAKNGWEAWPAFNGLGFMLRGEGLFPNHYGLLNSPRTFGHTGAGSAMFWVNPDLDLTFVMLTAGWLDDTAHILRFQRLGDMVLSAVVDA